MKIYPIIFLLLVFRLVLAFLMPIVADESYYLLWSQYPALSYVDHPGMIAWINTIFIFIFKEPLLGIRLASFATLLVTLFFIYKTALLITSKKVAQQITLFFVLIPYICFIGITMQVEQPLIMFSAGLFYYFVKFLLTKKTQYFYALSLWAGLAFLSKYTILFLILGMGLLLIIDKNYRKSLLSFHFIGACLLFGVLISPVLWWNYLHDFISFKFHLSRIGDSFWGKSSLEFIFSQIIYFSPVAFFYMIKYQKKLRGHWDWITNSTDKLKSELVAQKLFFLGIWIFTIFLILSFKTQVWGHWTAIMYLPFALAIGTILPDKIFRINRFMGGFMIFLIIILGFSGPAIFVKHNLYQQNYDLYEKVGILKTEKYPLRIFADFHGSIGQLSYYLKVPVLFPQGEFKLSGLWGEQQFKFWQNTQLQKEDNILFFTRNLSPEKLVKLKNYFQKITILPDLKLNVLEGHIAQGSFLYCEQARKNFKF
jgi:4-amino-4-deoxy-L-arabinose transferase-like glycosyltransferase